MCAETRDSGRWTTERRHQPFQSSNKYCSLRQWVRENERRSGNTSQFSLVVSTVLFECMYGQYEYLHDDEIACLNFVTAWSRQQGRRSVKGPDTFRLSSFVVGSNVRAIVSLGLARKYIYGREICLLSVGPPSLEEPGDRIVSRMYDPTASPLLQLDMGPGDRQKSRAFLSFRTATWLTMPVVICLSQRLSHACPSTSLTKVKPRMAH